MTDFRTLTPEQRAAYTRHVEQVNLEASKSGGREYRMPVGVAARTVQIPRTPNSGGRQSFNGSHRVAAQ